MALDREFMAFYGKLMTVAREELSASCEGKEGEKFAQMLFSKYQAAGRPKVQPWMSTELGKQFLCVGSRPEWVEEEPAWPFFAEKPMVFIGQFTLPETNVTRQCLTWDTVVYVFGARVPCQDGYQMEYRIVEQICGLEQQGGTHRHIKGES